MHKVSKITSLARSRAQFISPTWRYGWLNSFYAQIYTQTNAGLNALEIRKILDGISKYRRNCYVHLSLLHGPLDLSELHSNFTYSDCCLCSPTTNCTEKGCGGPSKYWSCNCWTSSNAPCCIVNKKKTFKLTLKTVKHFSLPSHLSVSQSLFSDAKKEMKRASSTSKSSFRNYISSLPSIQCEKWPRREQKECLDVDAI